MNQDTISLRDLLDDVPIESLPIETPITDGGINCLRCKHCLMAKAPGHTDFTRAIDAKGQAVEDAAIPIYCAKAKRNRPAYIWERCPIADPRIYRPSGPRRFGDRSFYLTPVERLFLKALFPTAPEERLCRATGRKWREVARTARRNGIHRSPELVLANIRKGTAAARSLLNAPRFNRAQREYIAACFNGDFWPGRGASISPQGAPTKLKEKNEWIRQEIVREVNARGQAFKWDSILNHAHEMQPGSKRRRSKWDAVNRPKTGKYLAAVDGQTGACLRS